MPDSSPGGLFSRAGRAALAVFIAAGLVAAGGTLLGGGTHVQSARPGPEGQTVRSVCAAGCDHTAIAAALEASSPGDLVTVGPGVYTERIRLKAGVAVSGTPGVTYLNGGRQGPVVIAEGQAIGRDTRLAGFIVEDGRAPDGAGIRVSGGAAPVLEDLVIRNNAATGPAARGGGLFADAGTAPLVRSTTFVSNSAAFGGGLYASGTGTVIESSEFIRNASGAAGGGVALVGGGRVATTTFRANVSAGAGGGLYLEAGAPEIVAVNVVGFNNSITGGGIAIAGGRPRIAHSRVISNTAGALGGGLALFQGADADLLNLIVAHNRAVGGGAGLSFESATGTLRYTTIAGNYGIQGGNGDGVYVFGAGANPLLQATIIVDNDYGVRGPAVGRPESSPRPRLDHTNVWGNFRGDLSGVNIAEQAGTSGNISADPEFVGPTDVSLFLSQRAAGQTTDSPAVDAGPEAAAESPVAGRSTRTDLAPDTGPSDLGYHHPGLVPPAGRTPDVTPPATQVPDPTPTPRPPDGPRGSIAPAAATLASGSVLTLEVRVTLPQPTGSGRADGHGRWTAPAQMWSYSATFTFDPRVVGFAGFRSGTLASSAGPVTDHPPILDDGRVTVSGDISGLPAALPGSSDLVAIAFRGRAAGETPISVTSLRVTLPDGSRVDVDVAPAVLRVGPSRVFLPWSWRRPPS